ncbi:PEST proteolytic signal-containing nuclear protein-like isoform X2 [Daphnia pulicaria]|uniref:PEST proteolytic signal-containing nuclear protein-like isoform X2 n=1 Tax=Daphnia pulicaria TaxID=35523 RepID=UPI001EEB1B03|nr:PEST proteolytic signal-containing nuclear protein-like isoform X2 [Daphnia pulicaria]
MASSNNKFSRDSKAVEIKGTRSLKRAVEHDSSSDEEDGKDALKKLKQGVDMKTTTSHSKGLTIKLKQPAPKKTDPKPELVKKASVFGESSDSDEAEEMPPEARMRMKNIGRDTQTSAGPNSFGKTRQGFCDSKKVFERQMKKVIEENSSE